MTSDISVESRRIVYTPSAFAKKSLFYLQEAGFLTALKPHKNMRSKLSSYLFFVVLEGSGRLNYDNTEYELNKGDCVFIDCMRPYFHKTGKDLWKLGWVHFNGNGMDGVYQKYSDRGGQPVFHSEKWGNYTYLLENLYNIASTDDYLRDMKINEKLSALLTAIMEMSRLPDKQVMLPRGEAHEYSLQDVKAYIDENMNKKITLEGLANIFYINKFYLTRIFKRQYGRTLINYLTDIRITEAKRRLRFTDDSIEQIGLQCGFENVNYFSRTFKKTEGVSPLKYRKTWRQ